MPGDVLYDQAAQVGVNAMSDPGPDSLLRQRLDHLLLWRGRVHLDDDGMAEVNIPLNDW